MVRIPRPYNRKEHDARIINRDQLNAGIARMRFVYASLSKQSQLCDRGGAHTRQLQKRHLMRCGLRVPVQLTRSQAASDHLPIFGPVRLHLFFGLFRRDSGLWRGGCGRGAYGTFRSLWMIARDDRIDVCLFSDSDSYTRYIRCFNLELHKKVWLIKIKPKLKKSFNVLES